MVGKPQHNIKEQVLFDGSNEQLRNELEKTRKLSFAVRMLRHKFTIKDVNLNIFNREAQLAKPLIRLFQDSPGVLAELLPALSKCLDAKRKVKSTSLEATLYTAIRNLIPAVNPENGLTIDNHSMVEEVKERKKYFLAQLCYKCNDRLYELEQENKQYAILKAHDGFFKRMKEYENFKHRLVYEVS